MSQVARHAGAYQGFCTCNIEMTKNISTPPGWDASPFHGLAFNSPIPIFTHGWKRHCERKVACPTTRLKPGPLDLESSALAIQPMHLPMCM